MRLVCNCAGWELTHWISDQGLENRVNETGLSESNCTILRIT